MKIAAGDLAWAAGDTTAKPAWQLTYFAGCVVIAPDPRTDRYLRIEELDREALIEKVSTGIERARTEKRISEVQAKKLRARIDRPTEK